MQCLHRITIDRIYESFVLRTTDLLHATAELKQNQGKKKNSFEFNKSFQTKEKKTHSFTFSIISEKSNR